MRIASRTALMCALVTTVSSVLAGCTPASPPRDAPTGPVTHAQGAPSWCGTRPIELGLLDGYGGNSWRLVTTASGKEEAAKGPSVAPLGSPDGQGNQPAGITDI